MTLSLKRIGGGAGGLSTGAAADYYEREARQSLAERTSEVRLKAQADPSKARDEYYLADPSAPLATWWSVSGQLAPDGAPIAPGQLRQLLDGTGLDGSQLVQTAARNQRVAGWDLTYSAPKGVGVLWATGDAQMRRGIAEDMAASARAGLVALHERGVFETRRGKAGAIREQSADVAVALFPQFTSRAGDPQPHVHGVLINAGRRADGSTGALDPRNLYPWKTYSAAIFRAELADRLAKRGVAILEDGQAFRVAGVPAELIAVWSKRRAVILDTLDKVRESLERESERERAAATDPGTRHGPLRDASSTLLDDTAGKRLRLLKEEITRSTRRSKDAVPSDGQLEARWLKEMEGLGLSREAVWKAVRQAAARHKMPENTAAEAAISEALDRSAVVTERTLRRLVAEASQARGGGAAGAHAQYDQLVASGRMIELEPNKRGERVFSTQETLDRERRMLLDAMERRGEGSLIRADAVEAAIKARPTLADEQARAIRHTARGDGVVLVEGVAGSGKSFALAAVVEAAKASGARVVGLAPSWTAADVIRQEAALPGSRALQGFVKDLEAGRVRFGQTPLAGAEQGVRYLGGKVVLLVDEAAMASSRDMATLVSHARRHKAQVILVGDRRQLRAVEPGAPFAALADALGVARMEDVRRQATPWQREASRLFAGGDSVEGLARYDAMGRVRWARDASRAVVMVADAWERNRQAKPGPDRVVLAARNADVHAINQEIRGRLLAERELGDEAVTVKTMHAGGRKGGRGEARLMELRAGDRVAVGVTLIRSGRDVLANDVATLEAWSGSRNDPLLKLRMDRTGKLVTLRLSELAPPSRLDEADAPKEKRLPILQHAYAQTIHKAQGRTTDYTVVHAGDGLDASRAYVAMTRHRKDAIVIADAGAIAQRLAADGEKPTRDAVRMAFLRAAKASSDGLNASDYVVDKQTWLRTGDPHALPETFRETRTQAIMRFAKVAAIRAGKTIKWRPERVRAPEIAPQATHPAEALRAPPQVVPSERKEPTLRNKVEAWLGTEAEIRAPLVALGHSELGLNIGQIATAARRHFDLPENRLDWLAAQAEAKLLPAVEALTAQIEETAKRQASARMEGRCRRYETMIASGLWGPESAVKAMVRDEAKIQGDRSKVAYPLPDATLAEIARPIAAKMFNGREMPKPAQAPQMKTPPPNLLGAERSRGRGMRR